jgi:uncharacterized cofD-like protein
LLNLIGSRVWVSLKVAMKTGMKKIVVIGGGTGTYTVLSGLKKYTGEDLGISAVVTVSDSGGSTGRLRDEFGYLPVGDFRMALVALSDTHILRDLFLYRFNKGTGLNGHNFGNLFLTALTEVLGCEEKARVAASEILAVKGKVLPITLENVTLLARYEDGKVLEGESTIDEPPPTHDGTQRIKNLWLEPEPSISEKAKEEILGADLIVIGPGDLYTSILSNIVVSGAKEAVRDSNAKVIYVVNLMTKYGQTHSFTAMDHVSEIKSYIDRKPDYVLFNTTPLPEDILDKYAKENDYPVKDDLGDTGVFRGDFLAEEEVSKPTGDVLKRSLIRHDSDKLARVIIEKLSEGGLTL